MTDDDDVIALARDLRERDRRALRSLTWLVVVVAPLVWLAAMCAPTETDCFAMQSEAKGHLRMLDEARRRGALESWRPVTEHTRYAYFVVDDDHTLYAVATDPVLTSDTWRMTLEGKLDHIVEGCR